MRKTPSEKSRDYRDVIVFEKLRFRDRLVWTVGLRVEIKLRFRDGLVWTVGLRVEIKLRFRDRISVDGRSKSRNKASVFVTD